MRGTWLLIGCLVACTADDPPTWGDGISCDFGDVAPDPVTDSRLERNACLDNGGAGLRVSHPVDNTGGFVTMLKNRLERNEIGLRFTGFLCSVGGSTIRRNRAGGMRIDTVSCALNNNKVRDNGRFGIWMINSSGIVGSAQGLLDNDIRGNGGDGVHLSGGARAVIGNHIKGNRGDGVSLDTAAHPYSVTGNVITGNGHD